MLTTGGKSEAYAMKLYPALPEEAFIQVGDFIGTGVKHCARRGIRARHRRRHDGQAVEDGQRQDADARRRLGGEHGAPGRAGRRSWARAEAVLAEIRAANTARHVLELCQREGLGGVTALVCRRVARTAAATPEARSTCTRSLVDFNGSTASGDAREGA